MSMKQIQILENIFSGKDKTRVIYWGHSRDDENIYRVFDYHPDSKMYRDIPNISPVQLRELSEAGFWVSIVDTFFVFSIPDSD